MLAQRINRIVADREMFEGLSESLKTVLRYVEVRLWLNSSDKFCWKRFRRRCRVYEDAHK